MAKENANIKNKKKFFYCLSLFKGQEFITETVIEGFTYLNFFQLSPRFAI